VTKHNAFATLAPVLSDNPTHQGLTKMPRQTMILMMGWQGKHEANGLSNGMCW